MKKNKLTKVLNSFVVMAFSLAVAASGANAFTPKVKSSDKNLVLSMPQTIANKQPLNITAESAVRGPLSNKISEITYTWNVDVCGYTKKVTTKLSQNPTAFRHTIKGVFINGCKVKVDLDTAIRHAPTSNAIKKGEPGDGVVLVSRINGKLNLTGDIQLTGPSKVKVGSTGNYTATYKMDSNQKPIWFAGYVCGTLKTGFNPELHPYNKTAFNWQPKQVQQCNAEALTVYTTTEKNGLISNIEYAVKKLPISSY